MKIRLWLTAIWLGSLFAAILICESLFLRSTAQGVPLLLPHDRPLIYTSLAVLYGPLALILAAWYAKPFPAPRQREREDVLGKLALLTTVAFNAVVLYLLLGVHGGDDSVDVVLSMVRKVSIALNFLVAPANAYFFGLKKGK